jgi:hypothetical protein
VEQSWRGACHHEFVKVEASGDEEGKWMGEPKMTVP